MNILVIRLHRFGDIIQLTPMLQGLKRKYRHCKITVLTSSEMEDLLRDNPDVDEIISFPEKKYRYYLKNHRQRYAHVYNDMYEILSELKKRNFHIIINKHYELGGILAHLVGAKQILGQVFSPRGEVFLNDPVSAKFYSSILNNRKNNRRNLADWACRIARITPGSATLHFPITEVDRRAAESLLQQFSNGHASFTAVQMGAAKSFRQWGSENYFRVIQWLIEAKNQTIILLGTDDERCTADRVHALLGKSDRGTIDLIGKTDFKTLGAILQQCVGLITCDTGTMHMASAVGTPVIALFYGTAFPWETGPYGNGHLVLYADMECSPCFFPDNCTQGEACRNVITPEHVCLAFEMLESLKAGRKVPINFPSGNVKLYQTLLKPGRDLELSPVNDVSHCFRTTYDVSPRIDESLEAWRNMMILRGESVIKQLHHGDTEGFMASFNEYAEQWIKLLLYSKDYLGNSRADKEITSYLRPIFDEAIRSMESRDYAVLSDLILHDLKELTFLIPSLIASARSGYSVGDGLSGAAL